MRSRFFKSCAVVAASIILNGCANNAQTGAGLGGGLGCLAAIAIAKQTGADPAAACAVGALAGGYVGYLEGKKRDIALAVQTRQEILANTQGTDTQVNVYSRQQPVPVEERAPANVQNVEVVDKMVVQVPNSLIERGDNRAAQSFARVGNYLASVNSNSVVTVNARNTDEANYIVGRIRSGYGQKQNLEPQKIRYVYAELRRGTQASVEVSHTT
jgi:hypothetical protein